MERRGSTATRIGATLVLSLAALGCGQSYTTILEAVPPAQAQPVKPVEVPVVPICLGLPVEQCRDNATTAMESVSMGTHTVDQVIRITVRCKGVCTPKNGEGETRIDYDDGTNEISGWGYTSS